MSLKKGEVELCGEKYPVEMIEGERFIDGRTIDDFIDWLFEEKKFDQIKIIASLGHDILRLNK